MVGRHGTGVSSERRVQLSSLKSQVSSLRSQVESCPLKLESCELRQRWPAPSHPRPIVIIGAGAIVRTAHLPAYKRVGLPVAGLFDIRLESAHETARQFGVATVFSSLDEASASSGAVFDVAVPGDQVLGVLGR